jgi:molybdopterin-containing oxidoreductase family membrane subunit
MVATLAIPIRAYYGLQDFITIATSTTWPKVMLATGLIVFYGYLVEIFTAFYSGNVYEIAMIKNRVMGPYWPSWWALILCNGVLPQLFWLKWVRTNIAALFVMSIVVNIGMWLERFVIIVTSLHHDFLPPRGTCSTPPSGTGARTSARSGCSCSCCCCSSDSCR